MIPETEDTFESCWSFPHHLKLGVRIRSSDGEPVLFIQSTGEPDLKRPATIDRLVSTAAARDLRVSEPPAPPVLLQTFAAQLRALWDKMRAWRMVKQVPSD
jgi:hypothetical protein